MALGTTTAGRVAMLSSVWTLIGPCRVSLMEEAFHHFAERLGSARWFLGPRLEEG